MSSKMFTLSVICAAALVGSASLAMAKQRHEQKPDAAALSSYAMDQQLQTGPYAPPAQKAQPPAPVLPFTWEEKRWFENARGVEGN